METRLLQTAQQKKQWLDRIIRWPGDSHPISTIDWSLLLNQYLINLPTQWTIVELDEEIPSPFADLWAAKYREWQHGSNIGGRSEHNNLGMSYAWYVMEHQPTFDELDLCDSPDMRARGNHHTIVGDIGQCSPMAMMNGLEDLSFHSLWISVLDYHLQVVIEFSYSPPAIMANETLAKLGMLKNIGEAVKKAFWCPDCKCWAIPDQEIQNYENYLASVNKPIP